MFQFGVHGAKHSEKTFLSPTANKLFQVKFCISGSQRNTRLQKSKTVKVIFFPMIPYFWFLLSTQLAILTVFHPLSS